MKYLIALTVMASGFCQSSTPKLPEGSGRAQLERVCTTCHGLENVVRSRMTKEKWAGVVDNMASRGAQGTDDDFDRIINYLAVNFGPVIKPEEKAPR